MNLEQRLLSLERLVELLKAQIGGLQQQAVQAAQAIYQVGSNPNPTEDAGFLIPAVTGGSLTSGSYGSPTTCTGTRSDNSATITISNQYTLSATYASGKTVWVYYDGTSYWLVGGSC